MSNNDKTLYDPIVRVKWLVDYLDVDQSTIWRWRHSKTSDFPAPLKLSSRSLGWRKSSIEKWLKDKADNPSEDEIEE